MKVGALLDSLETRGILTSEQMAKLEAGAALPSGRLPWYLHGLVAVGAWIASLFFLFFVGALFGELIFSHRLVMLFLGFGLIGTSMAVRRLNWGIFANQVCLAMSVTGHVLFFAGVFGPEGKPHFTLLALAGVALAAVLYKLYVDPLHRFLSCLTAWLLIWFWLLDRSGFFESAGHDSPGWVALANLCFAVQLMVIGTIFLRQATPPEWWPLGYATLISLLIEQIASHFVLIFGSSLIFQMNISDFSLAVACLAMLVWIGGPPYGRKRTFTEIGILLAIVALAFVSGPATLLAVTILLLGFALQDRCFLVLGTLSLIYFLFIYYYDLQLNLLTKSRLLLLVGFLFFLLYAFLKVSFWKRKPA